MSHVELSETLLGRDVPSAEAELFLGVRQLFLALRRRQSASVQPAGVTCSQPAGVTCAQTAAWLRRRLGYHPVASCEQLALDGAALCSLSREEWQGLASALGPRHSAEQLATIWDEAIAPSAALAAATPSRTVDVLPEPASGAPFSVIVAGDTGTGKSTLLNAMLGVELLPTSCCRACTAAVIEMEWPTVPASRKSACRSNLSNCIASPRSPLATPRASANSSTPSASRTLYPCVAEGVWSATVQLIGEADWRAVVEEACAAAARAGSGKAPRETDEGYVAYSKATSVYGRSVALDDPDALMHAPRVGGRLGQSLELRADSATELGQLARPYMDSADDADDGALWPLVRRVTLRGPVRAREI